MNEYETFLTQQVEAKEIVNVGPGTEKRLMMNRQTFEETLAVLRASGYIVCDVMTQDGPPQQFHVLGKVGTVSPMMQVNTTDIKALDHYRKAPNESEQGP